ncbi:MAG: hypothetical protein IKI04_00035, partial [Bacilli bacterium]|nr:hypothetical protein [Bacilli bacterium]
MKDKRIISIFIILGVIIAILGGTLAYWSWTSTNEQKTNVTFTTGANFSCSADGGGNITNTNYFVPTDCTNSTYAIKRTITTSITNSGSNPVYLDMWLTINSIGSGLSNSNNFKYALTTSSSSCTTGVVSEGNFNGKVANDKIQLLDDVSSAGTYYLYVWLDAAETSQSTMNQSVSLSLGGECTDQEPATLIAKITKNAVIDNTSSTYVTNSNGVQFNDISSDTNGKGIYIRSGTENDAHPIYYYRGAVDNNNVLFGGFCWKIVRTTDTGGIKLIYNGVPSNGECNNTGTDSQLASTAKFNTNSNSPADVGYMYGTRYAYKSKSSSNLATPYLYGNDFTYANGTYTLTDTITSTGTWSSDYNTLNSNHYTCFNTTGTCESIYYIYYTSTSYAYYITLFNGKSVSDALSEMLTNSSNENSSTIKTAIDTWYQTNMTSYTSYLEDTPFCNDRTIGTLGGWDPNGGNATQQLLFSPYNRAFTTYTPSLTCTKNDAFTVNATSTGNGDLT